MSKCMLRKTNFYVYVPWQPDLTNTVNNFSIPTIHTHYNIHTFVFNFQYLIKMFLNYPLEFKFIF